MGGLLSRSSVQGDGKMKKDKQKRRHQQLEVLFEPEVYRIPDRNENEDSNIDFINSYETWETKFEPQQMMNMNDPPGAPSTYSTTQSDITSQSWSSPLNNNNNSFYPMNPLRMTPPYNGAYIPNRFNQAQIPETVNNQSKTVVPEERSSKKVQFSAPNQQQTSAFKSLTNTQSCHDSNDMSALLATKSLPLSDRSSLPRSALGAPKVSSARTPIEKPIYIGVDFQATLAERGQTTSKKRHTRNGGKTGSDGLNSSTQSHRAHSHGDHQHKHQTPTDSPRSNIDIALNKSIDPQRVIINSSANNRLVQNNEIRSTKSRNNHRRQQQQQEQSPMNNEIKPSRNRENHRQHRRHHHHHQEQHSSPLNIQSSTRQIEPKQSGTPVMRIPLSQFNHHHQEQHSSPLNIQSSTRQIEPKQSGTPVMRIPLSQFNHQHQRQPMVLSASTKITKVNRTPIQI